MWTDNNLSDAEAERLGALVRELGLSMDTATNIEHKVMGNTKEAILERQEQALREQQQAERHAGLYDRARELHQNQEWQAVVEVIELIHSEEPAYPDPDGLLTSAREALEAQELERMVAAAYAQGLRHTDAKEWEEAVQCFEEVQLLAPGYKESDRLLSQARGELLDKYRPQIDDVRGRERQILDKAREQGEILLERTKQEASEEGHRIIQRALEEIERERESALREIRRELADIVVQVSEQITGRKLDRDKYERVIYEAVDDALGNPTPGGRIYRGRQ